MSNDKGKRSPALTDERSTIIPEPDHQELHLRVTALEGEVIRQQRELDSAHAGIADLQDRMAVLEAEVGIS